MSKQGGYGRRDGWMSSVSSVIDIRDLPNLSDDSDGGSMHIDPDVVEYENKRRVRREALRLNGYKPTTIHGEGGEGARKQQDAPPPRSHHSTYPSSNKSRGRNDFTSSGPDPSRRAPSGIDSLYSTSTYGDGERTSREPVLDGRRDFGPTSRQPNRKAPASHRREPAPAQYYDGISDAEHERRWPEPPIQNAQPAGTSVRREESRSRRPSNPPVPSRKQSDRQRDETVRPAKKTAHRPSLTAEALAALSTQRPTGGAGTPSTVSYATVSTVKPGMPPAGSPYYPPGASVPLPRPGPPESSMPYLFTARPMGPAMPPPNAQVSTPPAFPYTTSVPHGNPVRPVGPSNRINLPAALLPPVMGYQPAAYPAYASAAGAPGVAQMTASQASNASRAASAIHMQPVRSANRPPPTARSISAASERPERSSRSAASASSSSRSSSSDSATSQQSISSAPRYRDMRRVEGRQTGRGATSGGSMEVAVRNNVTQVIELPNATASATASRNWTIKTVNGKRIAVDKYGKPIKNFTSFYVT